MEEKNKRTQNMYFSGFGKYFFTEPIPAMFTSGATSLQIGRLWILHSTAAINGCDLLTDALQNWEKEFISHVWIPRRRPTAQNDKWLEGCFWNGEINPWCNFITVRIVADSFFLASEELCRGCFPDVSSVTLGGLFALFIPPSGPEAHLDYNVLLACLSAW